jgi:hypothetical protein
MQTSDGSTTATSLKNLKGSLHAHMKSRAF